MGTSKIHAITAVIKMDLKDKKVLVIGGGHSLDKAIITRLEQAGCKIVVAGETGQTFDVFDIDSLEANLKGLIAQEGAFDGFVFSVVHSDFRPLGTVKPANFNRIMTENTSVFVEAIRVLNKGKGLKPGASVVVMSSISSFRAMKAKMAFSASKAALDAIVRELALELADKGIRVNSIQKGAVDTDFEKDQIQAIDAIRGENIQSAQPLGLCKSVEVANLVAFLLSDEVKTMTGVAIVLDGGYTL